MEEKRENDSPSFELVECKQCKDCKYKLKDMELSDGTIIDCSSKSMCEKYDTKPIDVFHDKKKCPHRESMVQDDSNDFISEEDYHKMMKELEKKELALDEEQKKLVKLWIDAKYIPDRYFEDNSVEEINKENGLDIIDEDVRQVMMLFQRINREVKKVIAELYKKD